ncbi:transglycosylase domain-containing protein [Algivirga pacifica]|uniref:Transglycosylase domain-containing protein n=1 Tax=Algivirga pacifica TaxID=1162670 RepID=A0ABP9DK31_9BACT
MYSKIIKTLWVLFAIGVAGVFVFALSLKYNWGNLYGGLPDPSVLENPETQLASELYSADGVLLGKYFRENRTNVTYEDLSPNLINALYASEDIRFDEHSGIDFKATLAVPYSLLKGKSRGSSTLTQQLAKNLFNTRRSDDLKGKLSDVKFLGLVINKFKEWILALELERSYTKKEIMVMYLNTVDFGSNAFGIQVASKTYFDTTPEALTIPQAATLVGILQAPSFYNPKRHPERAEYVRNKVIAQMKKYHDRLMLEEQYDVTLNDLDSMQSIPMELQYEVESHNKGLAAYFRAEVKRELLHLFRNSPELQGYDLFADGLKIYTTIDSRMQRYAEETVEGHMKGQQKLFSEHWKGQGNPWIDREGEEIEGFLETAIRRTEVFRNLRKQYGDDENAITKELSRKKKMRIFTWDNENYEKDTVMSSMDSLAYYKHFLHTGFMAMDPYNGQIKAWVGGINFKYFKYDHVRQSYRQPGSTFKPMLYSAALEDKFTPCTPILDAPISFPVTKVDEEGNVIEDRWTPKNAIDYSGETMTLRQAMGRSVNTAAAYLVKQLTPTKLAHYARDKFGFKEIRNELFERYLSEEEIARGKTGYDVKPIAAVPSLCLGTEDVSVYEMVSAYGTFVNKGTWTKPLFITRIEDKDGRILKEFTPMTKESLSEKTAWLMTYMLRGSNEESGGTSLGLTRYNFKRDQKTGENFHVGGKTGTTANYSDGWFMGITKDLVAGTWVGAEDRSIHFRSIRYGQGARLAMPQYAEFMEKVYADEDLCKELNYSRGYFPEPSQPIDINLNCDELNMPEEGMENDSTDILPYMDNMEEEAL